MIRGFPAFLSALACSMSNGGKWPIGCYTTSPILRGLWHVPCIRKTLLRLPVCVLQENVCRPCAIQLFCLGVWRLHSCSYGTRWLFTKFCSAWMKYDCIWRPCYWWWIQCWHYFRVWKSSISWQWVRLVWHYAEFACQVLEFSRCLLNCKESMSLNDQPSLKASKQSARFNWKLFAGQ